MTTAPNHEDHPTESIRAIINALSLASRQPLTMGRRFGQSWGAMQVSKNAAYDDGMKNLRKIVERQVLRERSACAETAASFSPDAANAILSRPDLGPWREP